MRCTWVSAPWTAAICSRISAQDASAAIMRWRPCTWPSMRRRRPRAAVRVWRSNISSTPGGYYGRASGRLSTRWTRGDAPRGCRGPLLTSRSRADEDLELAAMGVDLHRLHGDLPVQALGEALQAVADVGLQEGGEIRVHANHQLLTGVGDGPGPQGSKDLGGQGGVGLDDARSLTGGTRRGEEGAEILAHAL